MQKEKPEVSQVIRMQSEEIDRLNADLEKSRKMVSLLTSLLIRYISLEEIENITK